MLTGFFPSTYSGASILSYNGQANILSSLPSSVEKGALTDVYDTFLFQEQQGYTLSSDLTVDIPGAQGNTISAGTVIDVYFAHFEPWAPRGWSSFISLRFDVPIFGYLTTGASLDATDSFLGFPGTAYPTGSPGVTSGDRGMEIGVDLSDVVTISSDFYSVNQQMHCVGWDSPVQGGLDQARIITLSTTTIPEPTSFLLALTGGSLLAGRRYLKK